MEIVIWDVGTGNLVEKRLEFTNGLRSLTLAPDGRRLAATVGDRDVVLWDVSPWRERARLALPGLYGHTIALSDDASRLATTNFQSGITVLGVKKGRTQSTCPVGGVISLAFAPGGSLLACGDRDATIWLWDPATGTECGVLRGYERPVFSLSFSPDGRLLAGGDYSGAVKVWDVATKALSVTLTAAVGLCEVEAVAFSPDGRTLAVAVERTVQLWDVAKGTRVAHLEGHQGKVKCLAFSPDGTRLASGSYDRTVRLWDMARFRSTGP
jgi:WD40 repeat protein